MTIIEAIILGLIQGLTEFLPVSSSGHLVLLQNLMGIVDPSVFFEVFLHFATLLAIVVFFRKRLLELRLRELLLFGVASIPAAVAGIFFAEVIVGFFSTITLVAMMLLVSGGINYLISQRLKTQKHATTNMPQLDLTANQALRIGFYQMLALIPGISRSGATVLGGLNQGLSRFSAFEFSFLMAIPVIFGANVVEVYRLDAWEISNLNGVALSLGFLVAFITGLGSLYLLKFIMEKARFEYFAGYCFIAGGGLLLLSLLGVI